MRVVIEDTEDGFWIRTELEGSYDVVFFVPCRDIEIRLMSGVSSSLKDLLKYSKLAKSLESFKAAIYELEKEAEEKI